jgi:hypothetical protein
MATRKQQVAKLAHKAAFVFVGKVLKLKAATMDGLAADNTAVVQVERVLSAPEIFRAIVGHELTVRVGKAAAKSVELTRGARKTFFANGWIFGASLAVDLVGVSDEIDADVMSTMVNAAHSAVKDATLRARLDSAEIGVAGTVTKVVRSAPTTTRISEHDPDWHEATVDVDEVVKGKKGVKQVTVLFPQSDDTRWHTVRKYKVGQQGVFILQGQSKASREGVPGKQQAAVPEGADLFTTLHPSDFLPLHELERVRAIARG